MSPNADGTATPNEKARAIVAAVLGVVQALSLCGMAVGRIGDFLTANEALVLGVLSALIGLVQTFVPALRMKKPAATTVIVVALLAGAALALGGCSYKGTTLGWGSISRETSTYSVQAAVMPDSNADLIHTQASYTRKDGVTPDVTATVTRPEPNVAQVDVWVRGLAAQPAVAPAKAVKTLRPVPIERTEAGSCRGGVCPMPIVPLGSVDKELWQ